MSKIGLVLEGGGTRAIYTSGVLDAFMENDIVFDYIIGVSAGSCNATSFIGKNYKRQHDITVGYVNDKRYMSIKSALKNGCYLNLPWIFGELSYDLVPLDQDEFDNSHTELVVVATNAETGLAEYFVADNFREECSILAASCALPLATKGVELDGKVYYDGGIVDSIPVQRAFDDGCDKVVVILTQHDGYRKKAFSRPEMVNRALKKYPKLAQGLIDRADMYNSQLDLVTQLQNDGSVLLIQPDEPLNCQTLERNIDRLESIYSIGYDDALATMDKLKTFLDIKQAAK